MSVAGVPIGTITAIYLTEYAKATSKLAKIIRFAVNTLAGVPAIVFGLFGLGFFIGIVGKQMDTWSANNKVEKMEVLFNEAKAFTDNKANALEILEIFTLDNISYWSESN